MMNIARSVLLGISTFLCAPVWAAVTHDGTANVECVADVSCANFASAITLTGKTTTGTNRCEMVSIGYESGDMPVTITATSGGNSMTLVRQREVTGTAAGDIGAAIFRSTVEPGTASHDISISFGAASVRASAAVASFNGCDLSGTFNFNDGTGSGAPSVTQTTGRTADTMVVDAGMLDDPVSAGANQTQFLNEVSTVGGDYIGFGSYQDGNDDTGIMQWTATATAWVMVTVNIPASGAAAAGSKTLMLMGVGQ